MGLTWKNLKENKCPSCWGEFARTLIVRHPEMLTCKCGFEIRREKYASILGRTSKKGAKVAKPAQEEHRTDDTESADD